MVGDRLAVIGTTFYKSDKEGELRKRLALEFADAVLQQGHEVFVVDGGTDDGRFIDTLRTKGVNAYEETQHGLPGSRREVLGRALGKAREKSLGYVCWSEFEKTGFVKFIPGLLQRMKDNKVDLIVPWRKTLESYPVAQEFSESFGNIRHSDHGYHDINNQGIDTFFGPRLWDIGTSPVFQAFGSPIVARELADMRAEALTRDYQINIINITSPKTPAVGFIKAQTDLLRMDHMVQMPTCFMALGKYKVLSVPIDYRHPKEQRDLETGQSELYDSKRLRQLVALDEQFALVKRIHQNGLLNGEIEKYRAELQQII